MPLITGRTPHDPARLAAAPAILDHAPNATVPDKLSRLGLVYQPHMGDNRTDPDCTAESYRECATVAAATLAGYQLNVARTASLGFYLQCKGLAANATPDQIENSGGANMLDVAQEQWSGSGFRTGYDELRGLFGTVPVTDRLRLAAASATFGMGWWGIRLYQYDEDNLYSSAPLDFDGSDPGALIGLHAIGGGLEYMGLDDEDEVTIVTYGMRRQVRWRWVANRLDEAHAFVWPQLSSAGSANVETAALEAALQRWVG